MKKLILIIIIILVVGGLGYFILSKPATPESNSPSSKTSISNEAPTSDSSPTAETVDTSDWQTYTNEEHGYSIKYPKDCLYGPLPGYCKQSSPKERPQECLCFLNGEDLYGVSFQSLTAENDQFRMASFSIQHPDSDFYNPPAGSDLIGWLKEKNSWEDIPDETNMELDGIPAVRVYTPPSQGADSYESIYFIMDDKLFNFYMIGVDNEDNREFYSQVLSNFKIED